MTKREEHIAKIKDTEKQLLNPEVSPMRKRDLNKYLKKLKRELRFYDNTNG